MDKILLAHNEQANESYIVEVTDGAATTMQEVHGTDILDWGLPEAALPDGQGLHVWEGTMTEEEDDFKLEGSWRRLNIYEMKRLREQGYVFEH